MIEIKKNVLITQIQKYQKVSSFRRNYLINIIYKKQPHKTE